MHGQYNTLGGLETQLVYGELYGSRADILVTANDERKKTPLTACTKAATPLFYVLSDE